MGYSVYVREFRGKPVMVIEKELIGNKYVRIAFGIQKAKLLVDAMPKIKEFVRRSEK